MTAASLHRTESTRYDTGTRPSRAAPRRAAARPRFDRAVFTRIVVPVVLALAVLAALAESSGLASVVIFAAAWGALDLAAATLGHDSREGFAGRTAR